MTTYINNGDGTRSVVGRTPRTGGGYSTGAIGTTDRNTNTISNRVPGSIQQGTSIAEGKVSQGLNPGKQGGGVTQAAQAIAPSAAAPLIQQPTSTYSTPEQTLANDPNIVASSRNQGTYITSSGDRATPIASYEAPASGFTNGVIYNTKNAPKQTTEQVAQTKKDYGQGILYPKDIKANYEQKIENYRNTLGSYGLAPPKEGEFGLVGDAVAQAGYKFTLGIPEAVPLFQAGLQSAAYLGGAAVRGESFGKELGSNVKQVPSTLKTSFNPTTSEGLSNIFVTGGGVALGVSSIRAQRAATEVGIGEKPVNIEFTGETTAKSFKPDTINVQRISLEQTGNLKGTSGSDVIVGKYSVDQTSVLGGNTNVGFGDTTANTLRYTIEPAGKIGRLVLGKDAVKTTFVGSQKANLPFESLTSPESTVTTGKVVVQKGASPFFNDRYFANPGRAEEFYAGQANKIGTTGKFSIYNFGSKTVSSPTLGELTDIKIGGVAVGRGVSNSKVTNVVDVNPFDATSYTSDKGGVVYNKVSRIPKSVRGSAGSASLLATKRGAISGSGFDIGTDAIGRTTGIGSDFYGNDFFGQRFIREEPASVVAEEPIVAKLDTTSVLRSSNSPTIAAASYFAKSSVPSVSPSFVPTVFVSPKVGSLSVGNSVVRTSSLYGSRSLGLSGGKSISNSLSNPVVNSVNDVGADYTSLSGSSSVSSSLARSSSTTDQFTSPVIPIPSAGIVGSGFGGFVLPPVGGGGGGGFRFPKLLRSGKKKNAYLPSFTAAAFGIKTGRKQSSGGYTGLEIRPLEIINTVRSKKAYVKRSLL